jgi:hypothetical protein
MDRMSICTGAIRISRPYVVVRLHERENIARAWIVAIEVFLATVTL